MPGTLPRSPSPIAFFYRYHDLNFTFMLRAQSPLSSRRTVSLDQDLRAWAVRYPGCPTSSDVEPWPQCLSPCPAPVCLNGCFDKTLNTPGKDPTLLSFLQILLWYPVLKFWTRHLLLGHRQFHASSHLWTFLCRDPLILFLAFFGH